MHGSLASAATFDWNEDSREARTECVLSSPDAGPRCAAFQKLCEGQENAIRYADTLPGAGPRQVRNQRSDSHDLADLQFGRRSLLVHSRHEKLWKQRRAVRYEVISAV